MIIEVPGLPESDGVVFKVAPAGIYEARVVGVEEGKASDKAKHPGRPQFAVAFRLTHDEYSTVQVKKYYSVPCEGMDAEEVRKAVASIARLYKAAGLDTSNPRVDTDDMLHADLKLQIIVKDNRNEVQDVLSM